MSSSYDSGESEGRQNWERLYNDHSPILYGYLVRRVGQDLASDILQESFLRLLQILDRKKHVDNVRAYLFQIARNLITSEMGRNHIAGTADIPVNLADDKADTEADLQRKEVQGLLESAKQTLNQIELEIFDFRWNHGFTQKEIAAILGKSDRQIRRDIEVIVRKIREVFHAAGWRGEDMGQE